MNLDKNTIQNGVHHNGTTGKVQRCVLTNIQFTSGTTGKVHSCTY